jgi:hypothetical protein
MNADEQSIRAPVASWLSASRTVSPAVGEPTTRTGHTLTILPKQGGGWLLARDANLLA